jgi:hypothetical protein
LMFESTFVSWLIVPVNIFMSLLWFFEVLTCTRKPLLSGLILD